MEKEKKYIVVSFNFVLKGSKRFEKWRLITKKPLKTYNEAVDALIADVAKSAFTTVEEIESNTGGKKEVLDNGGQWWLMVPISKTSEDCRTVYWKVFEL